MSEWTSLFGKAPIRIQLRSWVRVSSGGADFCYYCSKRERLRPFPFFFCLKKKKLTAYIRNCSIIIFCSHTTCLIRILFIVSFSIIESHFVTLCFSFNFLFSFLSKTLIHSITIPWSDITEIFLSFLWWEELIWNLKELWRTEATVKSLKTPTNVWFPCPIFAFTYLIYLYLHLHLHLHIQWVSILLTTHCLFRLPGAFIRVCWKIWFLCRMP